jgi:hypothetical protein
LRVIDYNIIWPYGPKIKMNAYILPIPVRRPAESEQQKPCLRRIAGILTPLESTPGNKYN